MHLKYSDELSQLKKKNRILSHTSVKTLELIDFSLLRLKSGCNYVKMVMVFFFILILEDFIAVSVQILVFWVVIPCSHVFTAMGKTAVSILSIESA